MPCARLDGRYQERYATSLVGNLKGLKEKGMAQFLQSQEARFKCPKCCHVVSVHDRKFYACGKTKPPQG